MQIMTDLGWLNAGGDTRQRIDDTVVACRRLKHRRRETNEGTYGTQHSVSCDGCGYVYHYDSGD